MNEDHPLPWLAPLLNGVEHANFFETRATEYSKAATTGNWNDVWSHLISAGRRRRGMRRTRLARGPRLGSQICLVMGRA